MKKYYVSIETAKVLKEKGYNDRSIMCYWHDGLLNFRTYLRCCYSDDEGFYFAPELHEVQQWLREEHGINISTMRATMNYGDAISEDDMLKYFWHIQEPYKQHRVDVGVYCTAYEQALESGINEALKMI